MVAVSARFLTVCVHCTSHGFIRNSLGIMCGGNISPQSVGLNQATLHSELSPDCFYIQVACPAEPGCCSHSRVLGPRGERRPTLSGPWSGVWEPKGV